MRIGSLFSGYGGLDMAVTSVFGGEVAWHCEIDPAASRILAHHWSDVPNLGDITAVDWRQVEPVDIVTGGFPCQDLSAAGRRAGLRPGTRSGLWQHMAYAIAELRPQLVVIENVRGILSAPAHSDMEPCPWCLGDDGAQPALRALGAVLGDLATLRYDARWCGVRASDVGAPHERFRVFVVAADAVRDRWNPHFGLGGATCRSGPTSGFADQACAAADTEYEQREGIWSVSGLGWRSDTRSDLSDLQSDSAAADAAGDGRHEGRTESARLVGRPDAAERDRVAVDWRQYEPAIRRWEHILGRPAPTPHEPGPRGNPRLSPWFVEWLMGLPEGHVCGVPGISRNDALRALGNGVVPQQAANALRLLLDMEAAE